MKVTTKIQHLLAFSCAASFAVLLTGMRQEIVLIQGLVLIFAAIIYLFDRSENKRRFWGAYLIGIVSQISIFGQTQVNYSTYLMVQCGLGVWLAGFFFRSGSRYKLHSLLALVFAVASFSLFFKSYDIKQEIQVFFALQCCFAAIPILLESQSRHLQKEQWFAVLSQQTILRLFFITWASHYRYEIMSMAYFKSFSVVLVSISIFIVFAGLINWLKARWEYLYESFLTVFVGYAALASPDNVFGLVVTLVAAHFLNSYDKDIGSFSGFSGLTQQSTQRGGFGGVAFIMTVLILVRLSPAMNKAEVMLWLICIFAFAWMAWVSPRKIRVHAFDALFFRTRVLLQVAISLAVLALFQRGVL